MLRGIFGLGSQPLSYAEVDKAITAGSFDIEKFLAAITLPQLLAQETEKPNTGRTLFWLFARYTCEHPTYFLQVWGKFHTEISLEHILVTAQSGNQRGMSVLSLLAVGASVGHVEPYKTVLAKFRYGFQLQHFLIPAQGEEMAGITALFLLAVTGIYIDIDIFLNFWNEFHSDLTFSVLVEPVRVGPEKGLNLLWYLAVLAYKGHPEMFDYVWRKYQDQFIPSHFLLAATEGSYQNASTLWFLAASSVRHFPKPFYEIWEKFKSRFTFDDMAADLQQTVPLLTLLLHLDRGKQIFVEVIEQMAGVPVPRLMDALKSKVSPDFYTYAEKLFFQKRKLQQCISTLLQQKTLIVDFESEELDTLFRFGEATSQAGYVNAFYDIHQLLENTSAKDKNEQAQRKIPQHSWHRRDHVMLKYTDEISFDKLWDIPLMLESIAPIYDDPVKQKYKAEIYLDGALFLRNRVFSASHNSQRFNDYCKRQFVLALKCALFVRDNTREPLIQKIAYGYITGRRDFNPNQPILPSEIIEQSREPHFLSKLVEELDRLKSISETGDADTNALALSLQTTLTFSEASRLVPSVDQRSGSPEASTAAAAAAACTPIKPPDL
jgi:hypothetical protein